MKRKLSADKQQGYDLIPGELLEMVARRLYLGHKKKYKRWTKDEYIIYFNALSRHYVELSKGNLIDEDGLCHFSGVITNSLILADICKQNGKI